MQNVMHITLGSNANWWALKQKTGRMTLAACEDAELTPMLPQA